MALFKNKNEERVLPEHIAIIMDGNGRWAKKRSLPRTAGHIAGAKTFKNIARYCNKIGLKYLTVYAFSTENWKRPKDEVEGIMNLLRDYLKDAENFKDENIKVKFIGDLEPLADDIKELIKKDEDGSKDATGLNLNIAINYGGRDEITKAVKRIVASGISPEDITEQTVSDYLYTKGMPDPDFIIRPSGEYRLSNYLIWQSAYAEYWFSDILWPDFTPKHLEKAIDEYNHRNRRFGGV
ncbi:MAG: isoprenyl transferase [Acutalibacteraceae bacterium]|nr:isoprenyl transferase [Acutalibacteraceae bacterium]